MINIEVTPDFKYVEQSQNQKHKFDISLSFNFNLEEEYTILEGSYFHFDLEVNEEKSIYSGRHYIEEGYDVDVSDIEILKDLETEADGNENGWLPENPFSYSSFDIRPYIKVDAFGESETLYTKDYNEVIFKEDDNNKLSGEKITLTSGYSQVSTTNPWMISTFTTLGVAGVIILALVVALIRKRSK